ncbi:MAG: hypothetical protein M3Y33_03295 [Actinomycetota bacterium]|nr:hypothetical protein [Actinomycetota bacterium]
MKITSETLDMILGALAEQLWSLGAQLEIVVIGGSALTALGLVRRATRDVDLLAISENGELRPADPLPEALRTARDRVARDFELDENWLNAGPTDLLKWGLPAGFMTRVVARRYGQALTVHFAGRVDQIHFKLFAMVDQAGGRHEADLRELHPSAAELIAAALWSVTQDPSPGYQMVLVEALSALGVEDADLGA